VCLALLLADPVRCRPALPARVPAEPFRCALEAREPPAAELAAPAAAAAAAAEEEVDGAASEAGHWLKGIPPSCPKVSPPLAPSDVG
jgi:hypothetical protein